ncbi:MAG: GGDEF domain-containing protein [Clostridiales bacterium]|nr:GGDEF domain-containing protein [Clostridiales bacterium]
MKYPREHADYDHLLESWLEFAEAIESHPEVRRLLFDPVTGLPTTPLLFPRINCLLEERGEVSLLCLNVVRYSKIEEIYGWKVFDGVMRNVAETLTDITGTTLRDADIVAELMVAGNAFVIILSPPRATLHMDSGARQMIVERVERVVRERLAHVIEPTVYSKFGCYVGSATVAADPNVRSERLVHRALDAAMQESASREALDAEKRADHLRHIIDTRDVRTLVHPVFDLRDMSVVGYEALSRGPAGTEFEHPDKLFKVAYDTDLVMRLERLCRTRAIEAAAGLPEGRLLFINVEPEAVGDPHLRDMVKSSILDHARIEPESIVLELTERAAINDFVAFRATLELLRALGFSISVDDAGAGYASLQCLAEVNPEWLKIDLSLVRGCDGDDIRRSLITSLVTFADSASVKLVAEGIETAEELAMVRSLGVRYGQGFYFGRPVEPFPDDTEYAHVNGVRS